MNRAPILRFRCRCCERLLQVPEELAGRAVRCPACLLVLHAPPPGLVEVTPVDEIPELEPLPEGNL
ncbi:MAG: hypothetical protein IT452_15640 [Planctomycetia bacterium]|nr:hypothetical protein [Planctomycetia bacterium]